MGYIKAGNLTRNLRWITGWERTDIKVYKSWANWREWEGREKLNLHRRTDWCGGCPTQYIRAVNLLKSFELSNKGDILNWSSDLSSFTARFDADSVGVEDRLSQINTLQQLTNIASHEFLREYIEQGKIGLHALWFDIFEGELWEKAFCIICDYSYYSEL